MSGRRLLCTCWKRRLRINTQPIGRLGRVYQSTSSAVENKSKLNVRKDTELEESEVATPTSPLKPALSVFSAHHSSKTTVEDVYLEELGSKVKLNGWLCDRQRKVSSTLLFCQLRDCIGDYMQLIATDKHVIEVLRNINPESTVCIEGTVQKRRDSEHNGREILLSSVHVVNMAGKSLPFSTYGAQVVKADLQSKHRYLLLRSSRLGKALRFRSRVSSLCRTVLEGADFTEVETPLLFKPTAEGAREFLVPTRDGKHAYALTQSPQQYKQILMASGVFRYYQIVKCFRDEDLREDRQPEFTQLDLEMAFASQEDVISVTEHLMRTLLKTLLNIDLSPGPFRRMTYQDSMEKYGTDKPDLRCADPIQQITKFVNPSGSRSEGEIVEVVVFKSKEVEAATLQSHIQSDFQAYGDTKVIPISGSNLLSWLDDSFRGADVESCNASIGVELGNTVLLGSRSSHVLDSTPLGKARGLAIRQFLVAERKAPTADAFSLLWVVDFPLLEPNTAKHKLLKSKHHPFTSPHPDDVDLLDREPLRVRGMHYDLVLNGVELGGGSVRVHDAAFQEYIFRDILKLSAAEIEEFRHLLTALASGCPPHAGIALGFDRLVATLFGTHSIRDVIAFPKTGAGKDLMVNSPAPYRR